MRRISQLLLSLFGAGVLALELAAGCAPGEVGKTDSGATGTAGSTGGGNAAGSAGTVKERRDYLSKCVANNGKVDDAPADAPKDAKAKK